MGSLDGNGKSKDNVRLPEGCSERDQSGSFLCI